jgi:hypothetical protein
MMSNCSGLVEKSVYASSDVPKIWALTVQPDCVWKSVTQSTALSVDPFST